MSSGEQKIDRLYELGSMISNAITELAFMSDQIEDFDERIEMCGISLQNAEDQIESIINEIEDGVFDLMDD